MSRPGIRSGRWLVTILASSLAFIDGSAVTVALPAIGNSFVGDASALQWTINAYLLPLERASPVRGRGGRPIRTTPAVDRWDRNLHGSVDCLRHGSILAVLLPARALQGVGAAMLMPNSLAILGSAFSGQAKGRAIGTWAAAGAIASAVGPPLGGWLVDVVGWRSIFFAQCACRGSSHRGRLGLR